MTAQERAGRAQGGGRVPRRAPPVSRSARAAVAPAGRSWGRWSQHGEELRLVHPSGGSRVVVPVAALVDEDTSRAWDTLEVVSARRGVTDRDLRDYWHAVEDLRRERERARSVGVLAG